MTDRKTFNSWTRWLRRHWPSRIPVRVRLVPKVESDLLGICKYWPDTGRATIFINDKMNPDQTKDVLLEEWTHLMRFHIDHIGDDPEGHDEIYGAIANQLKRSWEADL